MNQCLAAAAVAVVLLVGGCSRRHDLPTKEVNGTSYGVTSVPFRGRWWHYYERGTSWKDGGFLAEAEADFRQCLQLRWTDSRRARTYGMRFTQYFAHRELGAVLLRRGQLDEAEKELRLSLRQEPSAKAEYLLERISAQRAAAVALPPVPELTLDGPEDGSAVNGRLWYRYQAQASGTLSHLRVRDDESLRAEVSLGGKNADGMLALDLPEGQRRLSFILDDKAGQRCEVFRTITVKARPSQDRSLRAPALAVPLQSPRPNAIRDVDDPMLLSAMTKDARFRYVDRRGDAVLERELKLLDAGLLDRTTAAHAGKRLQSRYVVAGTITRGAGDIECYVRLISTQTGDLVAVADAYAEGLADGRDNEFFQAVAGRLRQAFPVVEAATTFDGKQVAIAAGERDGVLPRMRFTILSHNADAKPAAQATVEIVHCDERSARAEILNGQPLDGAEAISE